MKILDRLFGKKPPSDYDVAKPPAGKKSEARDEYYEDLRAQQQARAETMIFGEDEMSQSERISLAKKLITIDPKVSVTVVENGDEPDNDLTITEDAAPAGSQMAMGKNDGRYADIWSTFAMINPRILRHFVSRAFVGYPACTILGTHEIINPCCAMPGEDAMTPGYRVICTSGQHHQDDEHIMREEQWLTKLKRCADRMGLNKVCTDLAFYTRLYGIGVAIPRLELIGEHTMEEPYDPKLVKPGSYKGFSVVDPQRFTWDLTQETLYDPLSEFYMKPEYLRLFNREDTRIHRSWCVVCYFKEVGDDLKGTYMWGGVPLSQMLYERVFCADKLANEIVALAMSKRTVVKDGNMKAMIAEPGKTDHFIKRWNGYRNNQAIAFKEPGEQIQQLETSLSDLQPLSAQQYQYAAAIAGIPVTKLLKNVPSGLQATGQYEQDEYEQTLKGIQEQYFKPLLMEHYELYLRSNYSDREDLEVEIEFNPIQLPKATEIQQMSSQRGSMVCSLLQQNAITITEARAILKEGNSPLFSPLSADTPNLLTKIESLKDPEKMQEMQMKAQQQMMGGGMGGGMPGEGGQPGAAGAEGQPQQEDPKFAENKNMFQQVLQEVLADDGGEDGEENEGDSAGEEEQGKEQQVGEGEGGEGPFIGQQEAEAAGAASPEEDDGHEYYGEREEDGPSAGLVGQAESEAAQGGGEKEQSADTRGFGREEGENDDGGENNAPLIGQSESESVGNGGENADDKNNAETVQNGAGEGSGSFSELLKRLQG